MDKKIFQPLCEKVWSSDIFADLWDIYNERGADDFSDCLLLPNIPIIIKLLDEYRYNYISGENWVIVEVVEKGFDIGYFCSENDLMPYDDMTNYRKEDFVAIGENLKMDDLDKYIIM